MNQQPFFQYLPYLNANGIDVDIAPLLNDIYLKDLYSGKPIDVRNLLIAFLRRVFDIVKCRRYDLIWIEYEVLPWLPAWAERLLSAFGIPYIVDYDDAIFHRYDQHPNALIRYVLGHKIDKVMQKADLVIAGNQYLADRAGAAGAKWIEILPTVIDLERYPIEAPRERSGFTIGWIGSPTMAPHLTLLREAFIKLSKQSDVRLMLIGSDRRDFDFMPVSVRVWSEETEAADIQNFDVGIMPMPDTLWTRGKCGYKLIQYMACGRPVIASAVGANMDIVAHGENGFLASTPSEWVDALPQALLDKLTLGVVEIWIGDEIHGISRHCMQHEENSAEQCQQQQAGH